MKEHTEELFNADHITLENWKPIVRCRKRPVIIHATQMKEDFIVTTPEGILKGKAGDWLMFGIKEEKYICRDDIFRLIYDIIDEY